MGSKIIQWVKSHTLVVICSSLGVLSLTALVLGIVLPTTQADLEADMQVFTGLQGAAGKPANGRVIDEVRRQQAGIRREVERFLAEAAKTSPHTLLHPDVFPAVKERFAPNVFRDRCEQKRRDLLALLKAQDKPGTVEIEDYRQEMLKREQKRRLEMGEAPAQAGQIGGPMNAPAGGPGMGGPNAGIENLPPAERVKRDPAAGAAIRRAHEVYCYANIESLDPRNQVAKEPPLELMWEAQLSLWIQEDIIQSLAKLNNDAAAQLPEGDRWVGNLPIKRLAYIVVGNYLPASTGTPAAGGTFIRGGGGFGPGPGPGGTAGSELEVPAMPPTVAEGVFTKRPASATTDVVHLAVGLVIDANYLLKVIDEINKMGFYTPLLVNYEAVEPDPSFHDYIYGPGSVVRVRLEFEHCLLRDKLMVGDKKYADLMPASIKEGKYVSDPGRTGVGGMGPGPGPGPGMMPRPGGMEPGRRPGGGRREFDG
jgi:hypothetical protein